MNTLYSSFVLTVLIDNHSTWVIVEICFDWGLIWFETFFLKLEFDLIILFYMDSLNKTRLFYIKVHEEKNA